MRRFFCMAFVISLLATTALAGPAGDTETRVVRDWYRLILELVRHTPTYSPPVASRAFAYAGIIAYEARASGHPGAATLAGQLSGLSDLPARDAGAEYAEAVVLNAALTEAARAFFANTGPTGQRATDAMARVLAEAAAAGVDPGTVARSSAYGRAVAAHVIGWSAQDGGAEIVNMGFPLEYQLAEGPAHWVPTSRIAQQQVPLLPEWGAVRTFAMPSGAACDLPPPPAYDEEAGSAFHREAVEVHEVSRALTDEQRVIARFWSDDPMLSPTPPGHWISIALGLLADRDADALDHVDALARLGVTLADAFIGCWHTKFEHDLLRPVTYIRRVIDPKWEPLLVTPPFPEYPSGHSTQSGAAAVVLSGIFGADTPFTDATHEDDGLAPRHFASFEEAAREAALSRLYGGIHFRSAIERGLEQGRCIGAYAAALRTLE